VTSNFLREFGTNQLCIWSAEGEITARKTKMFFPQKKEQNCTMLDLRPENFGNRDPSARWTFLDPAPPRFAAKTKLPLRAQTVVFAGA
jgi:hypothetical protein